MNYSDITNNIASKDGIELARNDQPRKPKLTLKHLNKLRKIRELRKLEKINMQKQLELIYSNPVDNQQNGF